MHIEDDFWFGFLTASFLGIIALKLIGVITWSWWVIMSPILLPLLLMLAAVVFFFVIIPIVSGLLK